MIGWRHGVLAAILAVTGCTRPEGERTEILYSFWGSTEQMGVERRVIEAFEEANPDIRVRILPIGSRYPEKIQAMMIGNVAPDVIMVEVNFYDEWASRGVLSDLTDLVEEIEARDRLLAIPVRAFKRDGRYFAVPANAHGLVLYANLDALEAAGIQPPPDGWTWEELLAMGPKLGRRGGSADALTDFLIHQPPSDMLLFAYGTELFDDAMNPTRVEADSDEARAAFKLIRKFYASDQVVPPDVSADQGTFQLFRDGRVAFYISGRWVLPEFAGRTDFEWDVFRVPSGPAGSVTVHGGTALAAWSGSKHLDAAKRFLAFYASDEGVRILVEGGRYVPVTEQAAFADDFLALRPPASAARFPETMLDGAARFPLYATGVMQVRRIIENRVSQALNLPDVPVESVVAGLADDLNRWLVRSEHKATPEEDAQ